MQNDQSRWKCDADTMKHPGADAIRKPAWELEQSQSGVEEDQQGLLEGEGERGEFMILLYVELSSYSRI